MTNQDYTGVIVATMLPVLAVSGIDANPVAAGLSGAALASVFKLGVIDLAAMTFWRSLELAAKFVVTFFAGSAATLYGSPYLCLRLGAVESEARVLVYLLVGLVGSIAVRLIASNDRAIVAQLVQLVTSATKTPPKAGG